MKKVITMSDIEYQELKQIWINFITIIFFPVAIIFLVILGFVEAFSVIVIIPASVLAIRGFSIRNKFLKKYTHWVKRSRLNFEIGAFYFIFILALIKGVLITMGISVYIDLTSFLIIFLSIILSIFFIGSTSSKVIESFRSEVNRRNRL